MYIPLQCVLTAGLTTFSNDFNEEQMQCVTYSRLHELTGCFVEGRGLINTAGAMGLATRQCINMNDYASPR